MNRIYNEIVFILTCLHLAQHGGMLYSSHPTYVFWQHGEVAFQSSFVQKGLQLANVDLSELTEDGESGIADLSIDQAVALNETYQSSYYIFCQADMIAGAILCALGDFMGPYITCALWSAVCTIAYGLYFLTVGTPYGHIVLKISACLQGAIIVPLLSACFVVGDLFPERGLIPRSARHMIISGFVEFTMYVPNIANDSISRLGVSWSACVIYLMVACGSFCVFSFFCLPKTNTIALEMEAAARKEAIANGESVAGPEPTEEEVQGELKEEDTLWYNISSPSYYLYAISWSLLLICMNTQNGACIANTVQLAYGEDSFWVTFLDRFSWCGIVPSIIIGYAIAINAGMCHLFLIMCNILVAIIVITKQCVWLSVILFYCYKGSMYGSLGSIVAMCAAKTCRNRLLAAPALCAGILFALIIDPLNSKTLEIVIRPGMLPVSDFSKQQIVCLVVSTLNLGLWFIWRRAFNKYRAAQASAAEAAAPLAIEI